LLIGQNSFKGLLHVFAIERATRITLWGLFLRYRRFARSDLLSVKEEWEKRKMKLITKLKYERK